MFRWRTRAVETPRIEPDLTESIVQALENEMRVASDKQAEQKIQTDFQLSVEVSDATDKQKELVESAVDTLNKIVDDRLEVLRQDLADAVGATRIRRSERMNRESIGSFK